MYQKSWWEVEVVAGLTREDIFGILIVALLVSAYLVGIDPDKILGLR